MRRMVQAPALAPVGPPGRPLFGNLLEISRDQLGFLMHCARTYGDRFELRFGARSILVLNNPRDVEEVLINQQRNFAKGYFYRILGPLLGNGLLTSEGDFWRRQRRLAQPAFHRERIRAYAQMMVRDAEQMMATWQEGKTRDVHRDMMRLTMEIVTHTLFNVDVADDAEKVAKALAV